MIAALMGLLFMAAIATPQTARDLKRMKAEEKARKKNAPTQEPISNECVTVYDIRSRKLGILSGIAAPQPGIEAKIRNNCRVAAQIFLRFGYFSGRGIQSGSGIDSVTVGAGRIYDFYHRAEQDGVNRGAFAMVTILSVEAYPAQ
jgi:hypothetical protein